MSDSDSANNRCEVITEVAMEQAMEECGGARAVRSQLRRLVGLEEDVASETSCTRALDEGLTPERLESTRDTRKWVMCRAWELVNDDDMTISSAVSMAWSEARAAGEEMGIEV